MTFQSQVNPKTGINCINTNNFDIGQSGARNLLFTSKMLEQSPKN